MGLTGTVFSDALQNVTKELLHWRGKNIPLCLEIIVTKIDKRRKIKDENLSLSAYWPINFADVLFQFVILMFGSWASVRLFLGEVFWVMVLSRINLSLFNTRGALQAKSVPSSQFFPQSPIEETSHKSCFPKETPCQWNRQCFLQPKSHPLAAAQIQTELGSVSKTPLRLIENKTVGKTC